MVVFFLVYLAVLSLVLELKQNIEAQSYPEPLTAQKGGITMELYGKNNNFTVPWSVEVVRRPESQIIKKFAVFTFDNYLF